MYRHPGPIGNKDTEHYAIFVGIIFGGIFGLILLDAIIRGIKALL